MLTCVVSICISYNISRRDMAVTQECLPISHIPLEVLKLIYFLLLGCKLIL